MNDQDVRWHVRWMKRAYLFVLLGVGIVALAAPMLGTSSPVVSLGVLITAAAAIASVGLSISLLFDGWSIGDRHL